MIINRPEGRVLSIQTLIDKEALPDFKLSDLFVPVTPIPQSSSATIEASVPDSLTTMAKKSTLHTLLQPRIKATRSIAPSPHIAGTPEDDVHLLRFRKSVSNAIPPMRNLSLYINCNCQLVENDDDEDVHQLRRRQSTSTTTIQSRRRHVVMQFARKQVNVRHILDKLDPSQQLLLNPMFQILNAILILIFGYLTVHNALRTKY